MLLTKVYLAGGMKVAWREYVKSKIEGVEWLDPTTHGLEDSAAYTEWDLSAIAECDIVFAYFEATNPVGYNMAFEMGVAWASGKGVVFVNERFAGCPRPVSMLIQTFPTYDTLEEGIAALVRVIETTRRIVETSGVHNPHIIPPKTGSGVHQYDGADDAR